MSQHNVQAVRRYFDAVIRSIDSYRRRHASPAGGSDAGGLDGGARHVTDHLHADVRWTNLLGLVFEGKRDCTRVVDELMQASRYYSVRLEEVTDLGGDRVLAVQEVAMRGQGSATAALRVFSVLTLREGLIVEAGEYLNRAEALTAVGLAG
jgi:ketosteroid isomerase-like protein